VGKIMAMTPPKRVTTLACIPVVGAWAFTPRPHAITGPVFHDAHLGSTFSEAPPTPRIPTSPRHPHGQRTSHHHCHVTCWRAISAVDLSGL
jgi:hypothetical protein